MSGYWVYFECGHNFLILNGWILYLDIEDEYVRCPYCNKPSTKLRWEED